MSSLPDDDIAPHRDGDEDPAPASLPSGWRAVGKGSESVRSEGGAEDGAESADPDPSVTTGAGEPAPLGNAALVTTGILAGVYALLAIGWIIAGFRLQFWGILLAGSLFYQIGMWLAVLAAPAWFLAVMLLTRGQAFWKRLLWLIAGALLLVPWPFVMTGMIGTVAS